MAGSLRNLLDTLIEMAADEAQSDVNYGYGPLSVAHMVKNGLDSCELDRDLTTTERASLLEGMQRLDFGHDGMNLDRGKESLLRLIQTVLK